jgi:hypothetical protein
MKKQEMGCGCEILIYEDESAEPEIVYCHLHDAADDLRAALTALRVRLISTPDCAECGYDTKWNPDCINLLATNLALHRAGGTVYEPKA